MIDMKAHLCCAQGWKTANNPVSLGVSHVLVVLNLLSE